MYKLDFTAMPIAEAMVLRQTLQAALASARHLPVMFPLRENTDQPTPGQVALSEEILNNVLNNLTVEDGDMPYISVCLNFMYNEFEMLMEDNSTDYASTISCNPMNSYDYMQVMYGIRYDKAFKTVLSKWADTLRPFAPNTFHDVRDVRDILSLRSPTESLEAMKDTVNEAICEILDGMDDSRFYWARYEVYVQLKGIRYVLPADAATYNNLVAFVEGVINEQ